MITRILLPLDGSERAERAIPLTLRLATLYHAEVIVLRVVEHRPHAQAAWVDPVAWRLERGAALLYLTPIKKRFSDAGVAVDLDVTVGDPAEEILESARMRGVDLVVVTNPVPEGEPESWLSGTAHRVVVGVDASVLVLPPDADGEKMASLERVLVPVDGSPRSEWVLRLALRLAAAAGASTTSLYVVPEPDLIDPSEGSELRRLAEAYVKAGEEAGRRYLEDLSARLAPTEVETRSRVESGACVPREIGRVAREEGASLVLAGAHGRTGADGCRFGAVTQGLLQLVDRPLLVLQDDERRDPPKALARGRRSRPTRTALTP